MVVVALREVVLVLAPALRKWYAVRCRHFVAAKFHESCGRRGMSPQVALQKQREYLRQRPWGSSSVEMMLANRERLVKIGGERQAEPIILPSPPGPQYKRPLAQQGSPHPPLLIPLSPKKLLRPSILYPIQTQNGDYIWTARLPGHYYRPR